MLALCYAHAVHMAAPAVGEDCEASMTTAMASLTSVPGIAGRHGGLVSMTGMAGMTTARLASSLVHECRLVLRATCEAACV
jgi:hypothetical protein